MKPAFFKISSKMTPSSPFYQVSITLSGPRQLSWPVFSCWLMIFEAVGFARFLLLLLLLFLFFVIMPPFLYYNWRLTFAGSCDPFDTSPVFYLRESLPLCIPVNPSTRSGHSDRFFWNRSTLILPYVSAFLFFVLLISLIRHFY